MSIDEEIKIKQNAQAYYEKDLSYNQVYRQGVIDGYTKAIDEFAERLKGKAEEILKNPDIVAECKKCTIWTVRDIDEIAEQLKGGAV